MGNQLRKLKEQKDEKVRANEELLTSLKAHQAIGEAERAEDHAARMDDMLSRLTSNNAEISRLNDQIEKAEAIQEAEMEVIRQSAPSRPRQPQKSPETKLNEAFSWSRFVNQSLDGTFTGAEREVTDEGMREAGNRTYDGHPMPMKFWLPQAVDTTGEQRQLRSANASTIDRINKSIKQAHELDYARRDQTVGVAGDGGNTVETELRGLIPALAPRTVVLGLGVQYLPGLRGNIEYPRETNVIEGASVAETVAAAERTITFDKIALSPERIAAFVEFTNKLRIQSSAAIDTLVPNRLNRGLGIQWDRQLINGSGASNQLLGLRNISGIGDVAIGDNGGPIEWAHIVRLEEALAIDNADVGDLIKITNPKVRRLLKETEKVAATSGIMIWELFDNTINGYRCEITNLVPSNLTKGNGENLSPLIYGNWNDMIVGVWGLDIMVNPYSLDKEAMVRVSAHLWTDMDVEHPESFAAIQDIDTSPNPS